MEAIDTLLVQKILFNISIFSSISLSRVHPDMKVRLGVKTEHFLIMEGFIKNFSSKIVFCILRKENKLIFQPSS